MRTEDSLSSFFLRKQIIKSGQERTEKKEERALFPDPGNARTRNLPPLKFTVKREEITTLSKS